VDWDGALVRAIPRVREAQTSEQVAQRNAAVAELRQMLRSDEA